MMRTPSLGALVALAAAAGLALTGCAAPLDVRPGHAPPTTSGPVGSDAPPSSPVPGPESPVATGPRATAATGSPPRQGARAVAGVAGVTCPDVGSDAEFEPGSNLPVLPLAAHIKLVVRCETVPRSYPGLGTWSVQLAEVADSGFEPFLAELRTPSESRPPNLVCRLDLPSVPWFRLVDAAGTVSRPAVPTDKCGKPGAAVRALEAIPFRVVDAVRVRQVGSRLAQETGCSDQWKDMVAVEGRQHMAGVSRASVADLADSPASVMICLYRAGPLEGDLRGGQLIKGVTVTGDAAPALASAAADVEPLAAGCQDGPTFATLTYGGYVDYVEPDGCHRLLTSDNRFGAASTALRQRLQASLGS